MKTLKRVTSICLCLSILFGISLMKTSSQAATGEVPSVEAVTLTTETNPDIDKVFTYYQKTVDENLYNALKVVNKEFLYDTYGKSSDTLIFSKAVECINPCMAFALALGDAGASYPGISMTTVMDFNPNIYQTEIDWIRLSESIAQVDSTWYLANVKSNYNYNSNGEAYKIPVTLLQNPTTGNRYENDMTNLGVGPYQINNSDWIEYDLDKRVNPVNGFKNLFYTIGSDWYISGVNPVSDTTVFASIALAHLDNPFIKTNTGEALINRINDEKTQAVMNYIGYQMYLDMREKAFEDPVCAYDINTLQYVKPLEKFLNVDFSDYTKEDYHINIGNYVITKCLQYIFYKYYFVGSNITIQESDHIVNELDYLELSKQVASTFRNKSGAFHYSQAEGNIPTIINDILIDMPFRDCSSYVSSMMKLIDVNCRHMNSYTIFDNPMNWNKVDVKTYREMELGDVIVKQGHTAMLIAKDDTFAYFGDCGSTGGIRATAANGWSKYYALDDLVSDWSSSVEYVYRAK